MRLSAFLDGFVLGGLFPSRRPSAPDSFFPEDDEVGDDDKCEQNSEKKAARE